MQFYERTFSKRFNPVTCAVFVMYEKDVRRPERRRGTAAALMLPNGDYWIGVAVMNPCEKEFLKPKARMQAEGLAYQAAHGERHLDPDGHVDVTVPAKEWLPGLRKQMQDEIDKRVAEIVVVRVAAQMDRLSARMGRVMTHDPAS